MLLKDNRRVTMDIKRYGLILALFVFFSSAAQALECDVEYRAKKITTVQTWYGKVEKPKFRSGVASGQGSDATKCTQNALRSVKRDGWTITFSEVTRIY
jgi:hypothetical protein